MSAKSRQIVQISTVDLGRLIGITGRRVNQLVDEGVIPKIGKNQFDDAKAIQAYIAHREAEIRAEYEKKSETRYNPDEEKSRKLHFEANSAQIKYELLSGESHNAEAVAFYMGKAVAACRAKILSIPSAIAATLADLSTPEECRKVLDGVCRETAQALSDYDPAAVTGKTVDLIQSEEREEDE